MSEGELYKKVDQKTHNLGEEKENFLVITTEDVKAIFDEAKANFLKKVSFGNLEHMRQFIVYHKDKNDIGSGFIEALEWFLQWFGDKK